MVCTSTFYLLLKIYLCVHRFVPPFSIFLKYSYVYIGLYLRFSFLFKNTFCVHRSVPPLLFLFKHIFMCTLDCTSLLLNLLLVVLTLNCKPLCYLFWKIMFPLARTSLLLNSLAYITFPLESPPNCFSFFFVPSLFISVLYMIIFLLSIYFKNIFNFFISYHIYKYFFVFSMYCILFSDILCLVFPFKNSNDICKFYFIINL